MVHVAKVTGTSDNASSATVVTVHQGAIVEVVDYLNQLRAANSTTVVLSASIVLWTP